MCQIILLFKIEDILYWELQPGVVLTLESRGCLNEPEKRAEKVSPGEERESNILKNSAVDKRIRTRASLIPSNEGCQEVPSSNKVHPCS